MCGAIGIYNEKGISKELFFSLSSLRHREQESAGMSVSGKSGIIRKKGTDLIGDVFNNETLRDLKGPLRIGHVRYSTAGGSFGFNTQLLMAFVKNTTMSLAHNGNLIDYQTLWTRLGEDGMMFQATIDSEVILYLISRYYNGGDVVQAVCEAIGLIKGAYAVVLLLEDKLVTFRGPYGIHPLVLGGTPGGGWVVSSENAPIDIIGGKCIRDIQPGEVVVIGRDSLQSFPIDQKQKPKHCSFEYVYFARNDATLDGVNSYDFRRRYGEILYGGFPVDVDLVVAVPSNGIPSTIGYSQASGIPLAEGLIESRYMRRTFIKPNQEEREIAAKLKLNPLSHVVNSERIILSDDSIVRETASASLISRLRGAGTREVHIRITSPPVINPYCYGIDTPSRIHLIAADLSMKEIEERIEAGSLRFISGKEMVKTARIAGDHPCMTCFSGQYPVDPIVLQGELRH